MLLKSKLSTSNTFKFSHPANMLFILVNNGAVKLFSLTDNNLWQFSNIEDMEFKLGAFILLKSILIKELFLNIFLVEFIKEKSKCDTSTDFILFTPSNKLSNILNGDKKYIFNSEPNFISEANSSLRYPFSSLITKRILSLSYLSKLKVFPSFSIKYILI